MVRRCREELVWLLIAVMMLAPIAACQQQPGAKKPGAEEPGAEQPGEPAGIAAGSGETLDVGYLTETAVFAAVVHPRRVLTDPSLEMLPIEVLTAAGLKELGIDPVGVEQILVMAEPPGWQPQVGVVVRFAKPFDLDAILPSLQEMTVEDELDGKPYRRAAAFMAGSMYAVDDKTLLVAHDDLLRRMLAGDSDATAGLAGRLLAESGAANDIAVVLAVEPLRELVNGQLSMAPLPPAFEDVRKLPNLLTAIEAKTRLTGNTKMALVLHAGDQQQVEELGTLISGLLDTARQMLSEQMASGLDIDDPIDRAIAQYIQRMNKQYATALHPKRDGNRLELAVEGRGHMQITTIGFLVATLLPAVQVAREAARRASSTNNMKQIGLAMLEHEYAHEQFPARANFDENGKPLLSWRVHILPYLEHKYLYDQFKLDEPWDSPHNRELISKMPQEYRNPSSPAEPGMADYLAVVGEGMFFDGTEGRKAAEIRDGLSNTIMVVEASPEDAVIWTQPDDYYLDPTWPLDSLGLAHPGGFVAGFADGSVEFLRADVGPEVFMEMCTISDVPETVRVRGKITLDGGEWPKPGRLYFIPEQPAQGLARRPALAEFDTDGDFTVTTFDEGDGLIPGTYKITVECWEVPPTLDGPPAKSYVSPAYELADTSGLRLNVEPGSETITLSWDVPKPN